MIYLCTFDIYTMIFWYTLVCEKMNHLSSQLDKLEDEIHLTGDIFLFSDGR